MRLWPRPGRGAVATGGSISTALLLDDEAAVAALVGLKGVGRWTRRDLPADLLHRPDVLPADDLALLVGYQGW